MITFNLVTRKLETTHKCYVLTMKYMIYLLALSNNTTLNYKSRLEVDETRWLDKNVYACENMKAKQLPLQVEKLRNC